MASRSGSSRRKPTVTKKTMDSEDDSDTEQTNGMNGDTDEDEDFDLPEGTVVVKPEAVKEKGGLFSDIQVRGKRHSLDRVTCTACHKQINTSKKGTAKRHPDLNVLICRRCYDYHISGPISKDEEGLDEQCRWCSEGGRLFGCDFCHNTFCRACIVHNLGRSEVMRVDEEDKWKCYKCNPKPLASLVQQCSSVLDQMKSAEKKEKKRMEDEKLKKQQEKKKEREKEKEKEAKEKEVKENGNEGKSFTAATALSRVIPSLSTKVTPTNGVASTKGKPYVLPTQHKPTVTPRVTEIVCQPRQMPVNPPKTIIVTPSSAQKSSVNHPSMMSSSVYNTGYNKSGQGALHNMLSMTNPMMGQSVTQNSVSQLNQTSVDPDQAILGLPSFFSKFKNKVNVNNVASVMDNVLVMTSNLKSLVGSIRANVTSTNNLYGNVQMNHSQLQSRKTAVDCLVNGMELFLQELQISICGVQGNFQVKLGAAKSAAEMNVKSEVIEQVDLSKDQDDAPVTEKKDLNSSVVVLDSDSEGESGKEKDKTKSKKETPSKKKDTEESKKKDTEEKMELSDISDSESGTTKDKEPTVKESTPASKKKDTSDKDNDSDVKMKNDDNDSNVDNKTDTDEEMKTEDDDAKKTSKGDSDETVASLDKIKQLAENMMDDKKKAEKSKHKDEKDGEKGKDKQKDDKKEEKEEKSGEKEKDKKNKDKKEEKEKKDEEESDKQGKQSSGSESDDEEESDSDDDSSEEFGKRKKRKRKSKGADEEKKTRSSRKSKERAGKKLSLSLKKDKESKDKSKASSKDKKQSKEKKDGTQSDSSNFDSDLDKEIDDLSKEPKVSKRSTRSAGSKEEEKKSSKKGKKDTAKEKKNEKDKKDAKKKKGSVNEDSSSEENTEDYGSADEAEADVDAPEVDDEPPEDMDVSDKDDKTDESENEKAKEDLLKELDDSDTEGQSSDSEVVINSPKKKKAKASKGKDKEGSDTEDSDVVSPKKKKKTAKDKLLDAKLSDNSDSDVVSRKGKKRKAESDSDTVKDGSDDDDDSEEDSSDESEEITEEEDSDSDNKKKKKGKGKKGSKKKGKDKKKKAAAGKGKKRRRIKQVADSSDDEKDSDASGSEGESGDESPSKRKKIRKIKSDKKLKDTTKQAVKAEEKRRKRVVDKQKLFNHVEQEEDPSSPTKCPKTTKLVLEMDQDNKKPVIEVHKKLVTKLKPHQVEAVQFMWDCTIESLSRLKKGGAGCILAHCMGLGKTLSVISYLHTVMSNHELTKMNKVLVVSPLNTVLNWQYEFEMWVESFDDEFFEVFELSSVKQNIERADVLKHWMKHGGVMIIGYEMYRNLTNGSHCKSKKLKQVFRDCLVDPGPDIVVCDEGHILKNDASALSKAMNAIKTLRRIVLTGTPLQNNLMEYHCMVSFVKPNLLGTRKEFGNRFVNPMVNGQCVDSTSTDVKLMKRRAHILHEKLAGCVQRKDYSALVKFLSPKQEYVLSIRLSKVQIALYQKYLDMSQERASTGSKGAKLFSDYQALMRIWTHPWVMKMDEVRQELKARYDDDDEDSFIDDSGSGSDSEAEEVVSSSSSASEIEIKSDSESDSGKKRTRGCAKDKEKAKEKDKANEATNKGGEIVKQWKTRSRGGEGGEWDYIEEQPFSREWWAEYFTEDDEHVMDHSGKLVTLFEILKMSEEIGDKVLVFSQSLLSLDIIEKFLGRVDEVHQAETAEKDAAKDAKEEEQSKKKKDKKKEEKKDKKETDDKKDEKDDKEKKDGEEKKEEEDEEPVYGKHWTKGEDYYRMDGSTSAEKRKDMAAKFNDPENYKARLFIISTKAGGLGINLVAANRVIIFDASWNPSHDVQSIFRVYRFGQTKPVYVYRFLAQGTMEEKIYERQVTKQSLAQRVVDEHQIERHFSSHDLQELYNFTPDRLDDPNRKERPTPELPKDHMLAELLKSQKDHIVNFHMHDSLLENQIDQELSEEERKAAWKEYEDERAGISNQVRMSLGPNMMQNMMMGGMGMGGAGMPFGGMPGAAGPGSFALNQNNLLQLVQDMKSKYPHLPEDQLTARVQSVIRQIITNQYMQQQEMQRRQIEQKEMRHQQQLQAIQAQIQRQQQQLQRFPQASGSRIGQPMPAQYQQQQMPPRK